MSEDTPKKKRPEDEPPEDDDADPQPDSFIHPGHRLNVHVERNTNPAEYGPKPWLAFPERRHYRYPPVGFDTAEEANAYADKEVRKADRGLTEEERSNWD
ncbi:hypothetical protein [Mycobacterium sp. 1165178.9]|uniref:hypothetical protein n=1 Tax=Mycobacterium sp. 1165178.9 TaxID=1834070 RepID=UPI0012EA17B5|nr:hypothetical protein [Mycobacterium sp. 1165178.9]